ncbi:MAG: glycosyltransferase [Flavobacteriales bacterium]|jgi:glycosyltransferase involved in cell wall biosynthesis|nr:glycosyltransferase [Flavobacteriales bacterium]
MKKIKVCHLTSVHRYTDNRVFFKECTTLAENGYDVSLVAPGVEDHERNGVKIYGVPANTNRFKRVLSTAFVHVFKKAKALRADVYHFHDTELIPVGLMLRILGKKVIYDVHENNPGAILSRAYVKRKWVKVFLSKSIYLLEKLSAGHFSAVVTARPDITELFAKHKPFTVRNFPVLPNYDTIPDIDIPKDKPAVIYVGGMTEIRGLIELIKAFEQIDNAELWLLGFFGSDDFEQRCRALDGWKNTRYLGSVEADQIFSYIKKADMGIVTFLPVPNHITTLANKPFEYMACGLPMVMSDFDYWKQFFKDSTLYVNPADENDVAEKIKLLLSDPELMKSMGTKNLELTRNEYNWQLESKVLLDAYDFVLKQ